MSAVTEDEILNIDSLQRPKWVYVGQRWYCAPVDGQDFSGTVARISGAITIRRLGVEYLLLFGPANGERTRIHWSDGTYSKLRWLRDPVFQTNDRREPYVNAD